MNNRFSRRGFLVRSLVSIAAVSLGGLGKTHAQTAKWGNRQLLIDLELNRLGGRYNRPYVAVWIEDSNGVIVRTLAVWGQPDEYLSELKRWFNLTNGNGSVSGATRNPGAYQVQWDGKNDKKLEVTQGTYFVCVEAAREKGTYQLIREKITCHETPFRKSLSGNTEIKGVGLEYR